MDNIQTQKKRPKSGLGKKFENKFQNSKPIEIQRLTPNLIKTITGEEELASLEAIEAIFTPIHEIANLEVCTKLQTIDLINTGLFRISNLSPVAATLQRLCLCEQNITKMEGLSLPNLKELFLHNNRISKIEGLEGCPRLRKIWLHSNWITKMENLHPVGELEELALQNNRIAKVQGVESLVHLKNLSLSGNRISDLDNLQRLCSLPSLEELSLADVHYGMNPVVDIDGYRNHALCCLKHLRILDGVEIAEEHRASAEDAYQQQVMQFNDRVQSVEAEHVQEISEIEALRRQNSSNSRQLTHEMIASLDELEGVILKGRGEIIQEQHRQVQVREQNIASLEQKFHELRTQYTKAIEKKISEEQAKMAQEEKLFRVMERRVEAERDLALLLASIQKEASQDLSINPTMGSQFLGDHTADYQLVLRNFRGKQNPEIFHNTGVGAANLLLLYRFHNRRLVDKVSTIVSKKLRKGAPESVYFSGSLQEISMVLRGGLQELPNLVVVTHTDPLLALFHHHHQQCPPLGGSKAAQDFEHLGVAGVVVQCRAYIEGTVQQAALKTPPPSTVEEVLNFCPGNDQVAQLTYVLADADDERASSHILIPKSSNVILVPEYCMLLGSGDMAIEERALEKEIEKLSQPTNLEMDTTESFLTQMEKELAMEIQFFHQRVWEEVDPEAAHQMWAVDNDIKKKELMIENLRSQINVERQAQEKILRDFRNQIATNNPVNSGQPGRGGKQSRHPRPSSAQQAASNVAAIYNRR